MAVYRVAKKDLQKGEKIEGKEHPTMGPRLRRRTARQHLQKYGPGYYRAEPMNEKIVENINKKMGVKPIRRKPRPKPYDPLSGGIPPGVW